MADFEELVASRRAWISDVLEPWCRQASRKELLLAEKEWGDIAGRVDANATLWTWAWSRFPALVHEGIAGVDETKPVRMTLRDGQVIVGYPDARASERGQITLLVVSPDKPGQAENVGPFSIDDVEEVESD
ncbi:hypothetical protein [Thalassoroseus pseudoceratinae]|uniref:hypothetical protein n=1 Tax=Thalassoroseus pseudoceratinae TaxID=2713176 RepID=UPI00141EB762|nr:hypothetical protein [Thalassoroseus pseudoceratinae]